MEDLKTLVEKLVTSLQKNGDLKELFQKNPIAAAEKALGIKLPADLAENVVEGVKAKLNVDLAAGAIDQLKKLF